MDTLKSRDNEHHPFQFSEGQIERVEDIPLPDEWRLRGMVYSGFMMFVEESPNSPFREASIGPTQDGRVRAYGATEVVQDEYETDFGFEGDFEEALRELTNWFKDGAPRHPDS